VAATPITATITVKSMANIGTKIELWHWKASNKEIDHETKKALRYLRYESWMGGGRKILDGP